MSLEAFDDLIEGLAAFQIGPADEVFSIACEVAMPVHEAGIHRIALSIDDFGGDVLVHDGFLIADGNKLSVFHGKGLGFGEIIVNGIDVGVVDNEVHGCFGLQEVIRIRIEAINVGMKVLTICCVFIAGLLMKQATKL